MTKSFFEESTSTKIEILIFSLITLFYCYLLFQSTCSLFNDLGFDSQNILLWNYTAQNGLVPMRDIFYPYGLVFYYKNTSVIWESLYIVLSSITFVSYFFLFRILFPKRISSYSIAIIFVVFISLFTGIDTFVRYGSFVAITGLITYFLFYKKDDLEKTLTIFGFILGILFALIGDSILYSVFVSSLLILFRLFFKKLSRGNIKENIIHFLLFVVGFLFGIIPFLVYLLQTNALGKFIYFYSTLSQISLYAKTPFIHSLKSPENIFIFVILIVSLFYITYKIFLAKSKFVVSDFLLIIFTIDIILLQQKSIIRDISQQLIFIAFLLFIICIYKGFINTKKQRTLLRIVVILVIIITLLLISKFQQVTTVHFGVSEQKFKSCSSYQTTTNNVIAHDQEYTHVKNFLEGKKDFNNKVFSFPADPIYYILFNQKPPYYFNIYDGSSLAAQQSTINYLSKERINYILYNLQTQSIEDGVPDYMRGTIILSYIFNHYEPIKIIDNFLILRKSQELVDIFKNPITKKRSSFTNYLRAISLAAVPQSEGLYKYSYLTKNNTALLQKTSVVTLNRYLRSHMTKSAHTFLVLWSKHNAQPQVSITIDTSDGIKTTLLFYSCRSESPCIIDLSRLPIFYKNRQIQYLHDSNSSVDSITFYHVSSSSAFW